MEHSCYPTKMQIFKSQSKRSKAQQTTERTREPGRVERLMAGPRDLSVRAQGGRGTPNVLLRAHPSVLDKIDNIGSDWKENTEGQGLAKSWMLLQDISFL